MKQIKALIAFLQTVRDVALMWPVRALLIVALAAWGALVFRKWLRRQLQSWDAAHTRKRFGPMEYVGWVGEAPP